MVSMLEYVDRRFEPPVKPKTIKMEFAALPLSMHYKDRTMCVGLVHRIVISSNVTCSSRDIAENYSFGVKQQSLTHSYKMYI